MKKLALLACAAFLVACGQKETEPTETSTQVEQTSQTTEDTSSEQAIKPSSPLDYPREDYPIPKEVLTAIKPYVGYYTATYETTLKTLGSSDDLANIPVYYLIELSISEDGTYTARTSYETEASEMSSMGYITKDNKVESTLKQGVFYSGYFQMSYGQLEFTPSGSALYQNLLSQDGSLMPIYIDNHGIGIGRKPDSSQFTFDGKTITAGTANGTSIPMTLSGKAPSYLSATRYQFDQYFEELSELKNDDEDPFSRVYNFANINEFLQYTEQDFDVEIVDPKTLTGYYTEDNQEIKNIKYALYVPFNDSITAYDGKYIWQLSTTGNQKKATQILLDEWKQFNVEQFSEDN